MKLALTTVTLLALSASPALAGEARLHVGGKSHPGAHVTFDLVASWQQSRGEMAGTPMIGSYHQELAGRPQNEHCLLSLNVFGKAVRRDQRPVVRDGVLHLEPQATWGTDRLRVAHRSRRGAVRLYRTRLGRQGTGVAVLPTPSWIRARRPVTVVRVQVTSSLNVMAPDPQGGWKPAEPTGEQRAACDAFISEHLAPAVRRALASVRVARRAS
jgi:hypothetical protein